MEDSADWRGLRRERFGGPDAEALLDLVLQGRKTGTCWAARHGVRVCVGERAVFCDSAGRPRAVVETLSLERRRFCDVDAAFARAEGEGDLSLEFWRDAHRRFFEAEGAFAEDMELWCERFRLVRLLESET